MKKKSPYLLFSLLPLIAGCLNNYYPPPIKVPHRFPSISKDYKLKQNLPCDAWWLKFHDVYLNQLVAEGLEKNLDLHIAINNLERAQGQLQEIKLSWIPNIEGFLGYSTNPALGIPGAFVGIGPSYLINIAQKINQQKRANYNLRFYHAMMHETRLAVIGQILSSYFTLIAQKEDLQILKQLDKDIKALYPILEKGINAGLRNDIDLTELLVQEANIAARLSTIQHNIVVSQNALRFLVNANPGKVKAGQHFNALDFSTFKPGNLPVSVLRHRPDVRKAWLAVRRAGENISIAKNEFFPDLQLGEIIGEAKSPHEMFTQITDAYLAPDISLSTLGRIRAEKAAYKAHVNAYIKTIRAALREVDNRFSANRQSNQYFLETQAASQASFKKYQLQQGLSQSGLLSYNSLLTTKIQYEYRLLLTSKAKLQLALSMVALYQELGAGYKASKQCTIS